MYFKDFQLQIPKLKNLELPGEDAQFKMAPPYRKDLIESYRNQIDRARLAAVLALIFPDEYGNSKLALILRKTYKGIHSNQIGFPGGKVEKDDNSLEDAALRETEEEIGVQRNCISLVRSMSEIYIPPSNYRVFPFLGIVDNCPLFVKQESEVEDMVPINLSELLDDANQLEALVMTSLDRKVKVPAYDFQGHIVWGATAMMLSELKELLKLVK
ncbi:NUDIX hydrolase [Aegicerativicinus sediminis]|uniref:NUDIX hydrolase n=1 Tax=Aegicerativicinus sediminis TaxID=2893202 RepID=UPI001E3E96CB|nr:CoA pyrophosphatase [Aegicerativicinus sediminis]